MKLAITSPSPGVAIVAIPTENLDASNVKEFREAIMPIVQEYDTKPLADGFLETHTRYIDIQYLITGEELIGYAPLAGQAVHTPYDTDKDIAFLEGAADPIRVQQGQFAVFFPHDAHMPGRTMGEPKRVRKVVIKVAVKR